MNTRFKQSACGKELRRITEKLKEGHLYNAVYEVTCLQQAILIEIGAIRHGKQKDASWLEPAKEGGR